MKKERLILTVSGVLAGLLIGMVLPIGEVPENAIFKPKGREWECITPEPVQSLLTDKSRCWMCGNDDRSLMGMYRGKDDLGVLCLNDWYVLPMDIRNLDENGNPVPVCGMSMGMTSTGESGCTLHTEKNPNRGISQVTIDYGKKKDFDSRTVQKHLCQNCMDKLLEVMEVYGYVQEEPKPRELCLIDFQTMELYSLQDEKCTYYIRDYYVRIDSGEDKEITAVYAPDIEKK